MTRGPLLAPLRRPAFRRLAAAALVSTVGDGVFRVAIGLQVLAISGEPWALGVVGLVWAVAQFALLPLGGSIADRHPRRTVMLLADVWRAVMIAALGALSVTGVLELWHVLVLGFGFGAGNAFFNPASMSVLPDLVEDDELEQANTLLAGTKPAALYVVGPALGALLISRAGLGWAFLFDGATFLLAAGVLLRVPAVPVAIGGGDGAPGVLQGLAYVRRTPWLALGMLAIATSTLAYAGPFEVLVPYLLVDALALTQGEAAGTLAGILAASGVGALATMLVLGRLRTVRRASLAFYGGEATGLLGLAVLATMSATLQGVLAGLLLGAMLALTEVVWTSTLQRAVPREMLGRVASVDWMVGIGLVPLSMVAAGWLGGVLGARAVLLGAGLLGAVAVAGLGASGRSRLPEAVRAATGWPPPEAPPPGDQPGLVSEPSDAADPAGDPGSVDRPEVGRATA